MSVISIAGAIIILGILIIVHELGHFLLAKLCGVGVIEFSIGFGKKIWKRRFGETNYAVGLIPLGGYVRMFGDDPYEALRDPNDTEPAKNEATEASAGKPSLTPEKLGESLTEEDRALMADQSRWLLRKPFLPKAAIVLAGPGFNLIFAILLAIATFYFFGKPADPGTEGVPARIGAVFDGLPAQKAGLRAGDLIKSIDNQPMATWEQMAGAVRGSGGREMTIQVQRVEADGAARDFEVKVSAVPDPEELALMDDSPKPETSPQVYKIGMVPFVPRVDATLAESIEFGTYHVWYICKLTFRVLDALVKGVVSPHKVVGGPIAIIKGAAGSVQAGMEAVFDFMVLLSVSLAIFNLLPIPILDGGHLLFFTIEALKGSPVSLRWQTLANQVGMVLLIALMLFAISNDLIRLM